MNIINLREAPKVPSNLDGHIVCNNENVQIVHLVLKPGEMIEKHVNEVDVVFYVLEGKALLLTEEGNRLVGKDDCISIKGGLLRGFENTSVSPFKVLVTKLVAVKRK